MTATWPSRRDDGGMSERGPARPDDDDRRPFTLVFGCLAALGVVAFVWREWVDGHELAWVAILTLAGAAAWLAAMVLVRVALRAAPATTGPLSGRADLVRVVLLFIAIACGSLVASSTQVLGFVPALAGVSLLLSQPRRPIVVGAAAAAVSLAALGVGGLISPQLVQFIGSVSGLAIVIAISLSRRQFRVAERQSWLLLEERVVAEQERAELAALNERSRIARDIHDVLAHSLGGLVLQLDAVDALLDAGQVTEAAGRVQAARRLAGEGLDEARRAVDALRDPGAGDDLAHAIEQLIATHRSLGARADLHESGEPGVLPDEAADALRRAAQEALSNARRHAPGRPTTLDLAWDPDAATLTASTPVATGATPSSVGGGHGLAGIRERMEALGGTADWSVRDGSFTVTARIPFTAEVRS
jgi:signal transduction histidine kinase